MLMSKKTSLFIFLTIICSAVSILCRPFGEAAAAFQPYTGSETYGKTLIAGQPDQLTQPGTGGMETPDGSNCAYFLKAFCPGGGKDIMDLPNLIIDILTAGVIVAATIGIIICGYTVLTARDDASKVEKAKRRLFEIVIGLVAWVLGAALIRFILPNADTASLESVIRNIHLH